MSTLLIRQALETAIDAIAPKIPTAFENVEFNPPKTAYQRVYVMFADPDNRAYGTNYLQQGFAQVTLCYPLGNGAKDAFTRAELIRNTFFRGKTMEAGSQTVIVPNTPSIHGGIADETHYVVAVRIPFYTYVP